MDIDYGTLVFVPALPWSGENILSNEPIFRIHADLGEIMELGATPYGGRRLIPILGGRVEGPKLKG